MGVPLAVRWLLIINTAAFLLAFFIERYGNRALIQDFALVPSQVVETFAVWQIVTYMFLHRGTLHWLFSAIALYFFGSALERMWGTDRFLRFYLTSGVGAALFGVATAYLIGRQTEFTYGSSGAILGIVVAFGVLLAEEQVLLLFVPIKAKYLAMIAAALALLQAFDDPVGGLVHLGGGITGLWLAWQAKKRPAYARRSSLEPGFFDKLQTKYRDWRVERNKRRFQVYLKKHNRDHDRYN